MANGHVEIHDPFQGQHGVTDSTESKEYTSSSESAEDMVEFRILMAYAQRRRPKDSSQSFEQDNSNTPNSKNGSGSLSIQSENITVQKKKKKKKKAWKRFSKVFICLKPQTKDEIPSPDPILCDDEEEPEIPAFTCSEVQEDDLGNVAAQLAEISAEIPFVHPDIESDSGSEDDVEVEKVIGLLLRDAGDRLNESNPIDINIVNLLGNYNFFEIVINTLLKRMGLNTTDESPGPKVSPKTQIAVTCEATTRLSVLDTMPVNRLLSHGARFLKSHFSSWAEQQGGYENAFNSEDEEVH
ncbi:hypothetical protein WMY93_023797 [Mugilogobius chulae]|uniref:Apoptosis facilitator Bcl-2-like protein 14 n=1 Tax=Mugilogobius chulae TaxID=88201 RepID=A0AAW0NHL7_9GOBI